MLMLFKKRMPYCTAYIQAVMIDGSITAAWPMSMFQGQGQELCHLIMLSISGKTGPV